MMETILDRLVAYEKRSAGGGTRRRSKAVFWSLKEEVQQAVEAGFPFRAVWQLLKREGRFPWGYNYFLRLCHQYGVQKQADFESAELQ